VASADSDEEESTPTRVVGRGAAERLLKAMMIQAAASPLPSAAAPSMPTGFARTDTSTKTADGGGGDDGSRHCENGICSVDGGPNPNSTIMGSDPNPSSTRQDPDMIRCFVRRHIRDCVVAAMLELRKQTGEPWYLQEVRSSNTHWRSDGEYLDLTLWCCVGKQCKGKRMGVKVGADGGPEKVVLL